MTVEPALAIARRTLEGRYAALVPIDPDLHFEDLFEASRDSEIWTHIPFGPFPDEESFAKYLARAAAMDELVYYAIVDRALAKALGMLAYLRIKPQMGTVLNHASKSAALRCGFRFEGVHRKHMVVKGRVRDTAWLSIVDDDWPDLRARFERWLAPQNFHLDGTQKVPLAKA